MKKFSGKVLFLDRSDINTDEIIPAKYLTEVSKEALKPYLLEDLELEQFDAAKDVQDKTVIITRQNFGCGSSREHAPWALEVNGINTVIAAGFARIFRQNFFNCGLLAVELAADKIDQLFNKFAGKETEAVIDLRTRKLLVKSGTEQLEYQFDISGYNESLVEAGGWVEYADANY